MSHIVVVGAGQAGQSLVTKLRDLGFEGRVPPGTGCGRVALRGGAQGHQDHVPGRDGIGNVRGLAGKGPQQAGILHPEDRTLGLDDVAEPRQVGELGPEQRLRVLHPGIPHAALGVVATWLAATPQASWSSATIRMTWSTRPSSGRAWIAAVWVSIQA